MTPTKTRETYPPSVYELGDWLKAHPWVKRVKIPNRTFVSYMAEVAANIWMPPSYSADTPIDPVLMWRHKQAMIPESDWYRRESLFPPRVWRRDAR